jgi:hypothetical protein
MAAGFPAKANYATGDILTATNMNDLAGTLNYVVNATPTTATQMAGKNAIINGDFGIWQRGTSFSNPTSSSYTADRWAIQFDGTGATRTVSQQTFTPATAPVAGYEGTYFLRCAVSAVGTGNGYQQFLQRIEDVRSYAAQTVTVSFWAKADATRSVGVQFFQNFGSGGSSAVGTVAGTISATTSWQRFTVSVAVPSISGKTIGTSSYLELGLTMPFNTVCTMDFWGVQVESGLSATPFQTATGTKQGELAACQRYLPAIMVGSGNRIYGYAGTATSSYLNATFPVTARIAPTGITASANSNFTLLRYSGTSGTPTNILFDSAGINSASINATTTAGSPTLVANDAVQLAATASGAYILFTGCEL